MYKLIQATVGLDFCAAIFLVDGTCFPFDPDNTDYQEYLKWLAEGNTPLPAEENT